MLVAAFVIRGACAGLFARMLAVHEYVIDDNLQGEVVCVLRLRPRGGWGVAASTNQGVRRDLPDHPPT